MSDTTLAWDALRTSLGALLGICCDEQEALVYLDGDRLAKLEVQKASLVKQVALDYRALESSPEQPPADVTLLADRCKRVNAANRSMLVLTLQCIDGLLGAAGADRKAAYGSPGLPEARRRLMDLRV